MTFMIRSARVFTFMNPALWVHIAMMNVEAVSIMNLGMRLRNHECCWETGTHHLVRSVSPSIHRRLIGVKNKCCCRLVKNQDGNLNTDIAVHDVMLTQCFQLFSNHQSHAEHSENVSFVITSLIYIA